MVVCQYFLKGNCRFGANCRNDHTTGGFGQTSNFTGLNKSSFQLPRGQSGNSLWGKYQNNNNNNNGNQDSTEKTIQTIKQEMETWKLSKMWPFSCFSYQKEKPCITGLTDYSTEEIRLEAYKCKETGNTTSYLNVIKQLQEKWIARITELKNLNTSTWEQEQRNMAGDSGSGTFKSGSGLFANSLSLFSKQQPETKATGLFGSSSSSSSGQSLFGQSSGQSIFGKQSNFGTQPGTQSAFGSQMVKPLFGQTSSTQQGQGLFSQTPQSSNQSIFGQQTPQQSSQGLFSKPANQTSSGLFSQKPANATQGASQGLFSNQPTQGLFASKPTQGLFGSNQPAQGLFSNKPTQGIFGGTQQAPSNPFGQQQPQQQQQQQQPSSSLFGNANQSGNSTQVLSTSASTSAAPANPFLQAAKQKTNTTVPEVGSNLPVTEKDLAAFKADRFIYGQIPECPPPLELC